MTQLTELDCSENQLKQLPAFVGNFKRMMSLNACENELEALPSSLVNLSDLTHLNVGYNKIKEIPICICQLSRLCLLDLSKNQISHLPIAIGQLTDLRSLSLRSNKLQVLPKEIGHLHKLKNLDVAYNNIVELPKEFAQLYQLTDLETEENPLLFPPQHIAEQSLYATMMYLTYDIDIVANQKIYRVELPVTMPLQAILKQALSFFNVFVKKIKNEHIHFEVVSTKAGIRLEMIYTDMMDLEAVQAYLSEYIMLFSQKKITQLNFQIDVTIEQEQKILQHLNLQLKFVQQALKIYGIQNRILKYKFNELLGLLSNRTSEYFELNLNEINPGPATS